MKTRLTAIVLLLALPAVFAAQHAQAHARYIVKDLGTLGGPTSGVNSGNVVINSIGTVVGGADTVDWDPMCDCPVTHAFAWNKGRMTDLRTLPEGNDFSYAIEINSFGTIAGISANGVIDPDFGSVFVAALWKNGRITNLGTFGGSFSLANSINDWGQVAGGAESTIRDPDNRWGSLTDLPAPTLWRAALWQNGKIRDLGTLGGPAAFALFINGHGQVAGLSYTKSIPDLHGALLIHPFFWENGRMVDVGTLGGVFAEAKAMNGLGQVVGDSDLRGDQVWHAFVWAPGKKMVDLGTLGGTVSIAGAINDLGAVVGLAATRDDGVLDGFLWRNGVMTDLGALPGGLCNGAASINAKGQIVGSSDDCAGNDSRAWLSDSGGPIVDLNTLVPAGSDLYLAEAQFISDSGQIVGRGVLPNGDAHAFLLIPQTTSDTATTTQNDAAVAVQQSSTAARKNLTPEQLTAVRARYAHRLGGVALRLSK